VRFIGSAEGFEEVHGGDHWSVFVSVLEYMQGIC